SIDYGGRCKNICSCRKICWWPSRTFSCRSMKTRLSICRITETRSPIGSWKDMRPRRRNREFEGQPEEAMVSVVIPVYNEEVALPLTLMCVFEQEGDYEVIVAEGGSTDRT